MAPETFGDVNFLIARGRVPFLGPWGWGGVRVHDALGVHGATGLGVGVRVHDALEVHGATGLGVGVRTHDALEVHGT